MDFREEQLLFSLLRFLHVDDEGKKEQIETILRKLIQISCESFQQAVQKYSADTKNDALLVSLLIPLLSNHFNFTPILARTALEKFDDQAIPALIEAILHPDIDISLEAMSLLQIIDPQETEFQEKMFLALLQALQSPYAPVRAKAVTVLSQHHSEMDERLPVPLLMDLLSEENILVKQWARYRFRQLSPEAFSQLLQEIPKKSEKIRSEVLEVLRDCEIPSAPEITSFLISLATQRKNRRESLLALEILGKAGRNLPEVLSTLIQIVKNPDYPKEVRQQAIEALGQMKKFDSEIFPFLRSLLQDSDLDYASAMALAQLEERDSTVIAILMKYLQASSEDEARQKKIQNLFISFGSESVPEFLKYEQNEWFRPHLEKIVLRILQVLIEKMAKKQGELALEAEIEKTIQSLLSEANRSRDLSHSVRMILKELISMLIHSLKNSKSEEKMIELLANQVLHQLAEAEKVAQEKGQKVSILRKFELNEHITLLRETLSKSSF